MSAAAVTMFGFAAFAAVVQSVRGWRAYPAVVAARA